MQILKKTLLILTITTLTLQKPPKVFLIFTPQCYENLKSLTFTTPCLSSTISNTLSLAIVSLSLIYKIPQILKIKSRKSSVGVSWFSVFLDITSLTCTIGYFFTLGFPLMNYGEMISNIIQTQVIFLMVYFYKGIDSKKFFVGFLFNLGFMGLILAGALPLFFVKLFLGFSSVLFCFSKGSQIFEILKIRFSGSMSVITTLMGFAGIMARTFTIWVDSDDLYLLATQLVQTCFSMGLFLAVIVFRNPPVDKKKN